MINEGLILIAESDNNIHYYPYFTPEEMNEIGVFNENKNKYSDIQDEAIEWYHEYRDTLRNPDSENWLKELQYRYDEYIQESSMDNKQLILNLGWNPEVEPTFENVLKASELTRKKLQKNNDDDLYLNEQTDYVVENSKFANINHVEIGFKDEQLSCRCIQLVHNVQESSEFKRSELPDDVFGIPSLRKYPMHDGKHVLSAIKFFNHVEPKYEKELAKNIKKKMKEYNISSDHVGDKNKLKNYL